MRATVLWIGLGFTLGLLLVAGLVYLRPHTFHGSVIQEVYAAPDFRLTQADGQEYRLSEQQGDLVLLFFGYTYCPDVCPATLSELKQVRRALGRDAERVQVVFVTVDPERDTPERAATYARGFDPTFHGLSGTPEELEPVWKDYGVFFQLNKKNPQDTAYTVDHSSHVYLIDAQGNLRLTYSFGTPVEQIFEDVRYLLRRG